MKIGHEAADRIHYALQGKALSGWFFFVGLADRTLDSVVEV